MKFIEVCHIAMPHRRYSSTKRSYFSRKFTIMLFAFIKHKHILACKLQSSDRDTNRSMAALDYYRERGIGFVFVFT